VTAAQTTAILSCRGIRKTFRDGPAAISVLDGVDLDVAAGETVAIVGASGSGKSTLLNVLCGLAEPGAGTVLVDGVDLYRQSDARRSQIRNRQLGYVYQFSHLLRDFTAQENVAMPLLLAGKPFAAAMAEAAQTLARVGLAARVAHKPGQLSGGESHRVALARAIVNRPACILADEPTGSLDQQTARDMLDLVHELNRSLGLSFVIVTHDDEVAGRMDRALQLVGGVLQPAPQSRQP
jgi:lipoprotein-releasing system ATP-binding protein